MLINKTQPADADAQRARALITAGTVLSGRMAVTGSAGTGLVVRIRPRLAVLASTAGVTPGRHAASSSFIQARTALIQARPVSGLSAQHGAAKISTAAASGPCASKQYQDQARSAAAIGGALGPLPPGDPV
jgi:hypothetical protein